MIRTKISHWFAASLVLSGSSLFGDTTPPTATAAPKVAGGEKSHASGLLSPQLKAELSTSLPAYEPVKPAPAESVAPPAPAKATAADGEVLVLPSFVVRGPRPPKPADLLTLAGKLDHYLGPKDGFDRGLLNRVTLHWGNVSLFDAMTNETRAKELYADDRRLRHRAELLDFASLLKQTGDAALSDRLKSESDKLFFRKPALDRK